MVALLCPQVNLFRTPPIPKIRGKFDNDFRVGKANNLRRFNPSKRLVKDTSPGECENYPNLL